MNKKKITKHYLMLLSLVEQLNREHYLDIKADLPDLKKPYAISWESTIPQYHPDVTAVKYNSFYIFRIETSDTIDKEDSHQHWQAFFDFSVKSDSHFVLVIPKDLSEKLSHILLKKNMFVKIRPM